MEWIRRLRELLFPPECAFCGRLLDRGEGEGVCRCCREALPAVEEQRAVVKGPFGRCAVALYYEEMVRTGVHRFKFMGRRSCAGVFARYIAQAAAEQLSGEFDVVTFVPVSRKRLRRRGYDQSRLLAEEMAALWDTEAAVLLRKVRHTPPQSGLSDPAERRANVLGAYRVTAQEAVEGRRILLVDDVVTTGSTLSACADVLRRAGAAQVVCAALATPRRSRIQTAQKCGGTSEISVN